MSLFRHVTVRHAACAFAQLPLAARLLWPHLARSRLAGVRFQPAFTIGRHTVDFYCQAAQLAVIATGPARGSSWWRARERDLAALGILVLGFDDRAVLTRIDDVLDEIFDRVIARVDD